MPRPAGAEGPVLTEQALADIWAAVDASTASATKAAYRSDWDRFTTWTTERGFTPLPAPPLVVAHYVTEAAAEQTSVGKWRYTPATLTRWVSSINQFHTAAGLDAPGRAEVVRRALSGVRRIRSIPPNRREPLLLERHPDPSDTVGASAGGVAGGMAARRDMAMLLMGFAGAHRRSELVALTLADVTLHKTDGLHVRLRSSKTDQEARGQVKALPYGRDPMTCPPCAYVRWRKILHAWDTAPTAAAGGRCCRCSARQSGDDVGEGRSPKASTAAAAPDSRTRRIRSGRCSRRCTRPGRSARSGDVRGCGRRDDQAPRRPGRVYPRPDAATSGASLKWTGGLVGLVHGGCGFAGDR